MDDRSAELSTRTGEVETPKKPETETIEVNASVAATLLRASATKGVFADVEDNQAEYVNDNLLKLYLRQPDRSHKLVYVRVPENFVFEVVDGS